MTQQLDWKDLLQRLIRSKETGLDKSAWEDFTEHVQNLIRMIVRAQRYSLTEDDVQEILQSLSLRIVDPDDDLLTTLSRAREPKAFLQATVRNMIVDFFRAEPRGGQFVRLSEKEEANLPDQSAMPALDSLHWRSLLKTALGSLSAEERQLIKMRFILEQPISEIADKLGITSSGVYVRIFRIRHKLLSLLGKPPSEA